MIRPSASTTSSAHHEVLDLPVSVRQLTGAAAGEPSTDGRQGHRLWPVPTVSSWSRWRLVLEAVAEGPGRTSTTSGGRVDRLGYRSARRGRARPHRGAGTDPPTTPAASRRGRHRHTSLVAPGQHRRDLIGFGGRAPTTPARATWPSSAHVIASGHQSRLDSLRIASSIETAQMRARHVDEVIGYRHLDRGSRTRRLRPPRRRSRWVGSAGRGPSGESVMGPRRASAWTSSASRPVEVTVGRSVQGRTSPSSISARLHGGFRCLLGGVPSAVLGHQRGDVVRRTGHSRPARATGHGSDATARRRPSGPSRSGPRRPPRHGGRGVRPRAGVRGWVVLDHREQRCGFAAVAADEVLDAEPPDRGVSERLDRRVAAAPRSLRRLVRLCRCTRSRIDRRPEPAAQHREDLLEHDVHRVRCHLSVGR